MWQLTLTRGHFLRKASRQHCTCLFVASFVDRCSTRGETLDARQSHNKCQARPGQNGWVRFAGDNATTTTTHISASSSVFGGHVVSHFMRQWWWQLATNTPSIERLVVRCFVVWLVAAVSTFEADHAVQYSTIRANLEYIVQRGSHCDGQHTV